MSEPQNAQQTAEEEKVRERSQKTGVEGVIARKYPELYQKLKDISQKTGQSVLDLLVAYTNWALELREYSTVVTEEDLKNIDAKSLYSALKMLLFFEERYIRLASYMNIATAMQVLDYLRTLYYPQPSTTTTSTPAIIPPPPQPQPDRVSQILNAVLRAIEMFSMGSEEVRRQLAREIAEELLKQAQPSPEKK
jgi:hypothetical protein